MNSDIYEMLAEAYAVDDLAIRDFERAAQRLEKRSRGNVTKKTFPIKPIIQADRGHAMQHQMTDWEAWLKARLESSNLALSDVIGEFINEEINALRAEFKVLRAEIDSLRNEFAAMRVDRAVIDAIQRGEVRQFNN